MDLTVKRNQTIVRVKKKRLEKQTVCDKFLYSISVILENEKLAFVWCLTLRIASVFIVQTWFVPDEYWQSLEVAHRFVFNYGYLTWEWQNGIRSYLYPLTIAFQYKILDYFKLDTVWMLTTIPRLSQALLTAYSDYCFFKWCGKTKWAAFTIQTNWFWFYCGSRTLINTLETSLIIIALAKFPWRYTHRYTPSTFLWFVAVICVIRPTSAIICLPLCLYHMWMSFEDNNFYNVFCDYLRKGMFVAIITTAVDSYIHGRLFFAPWQFLSVNVFDGVSEHYGVAPLHWYFTDALPSVFGLQLIPFAFGLAGVLPFLRDYRAREREFVLLVTLVFSLVVLSLIPHKEHRFVLPLLPFISFFVAQTMQKYTYDKRKIVRFVIYGTLLSSNLAPAYYFSVVHQRGALDVMATLQKIAETSSDADFLFLTPCHSTPLYSHLHVNVTTRILTCEPNLKKIPSYQDEAEYFFANPTAWFDANYDNDDHLPSHVIAFDTIDLHGSVFERYVEVKQFFYSHSPSSNQGNFLKLHANPAWSWIKL